MGRKTKDVTLADRGVEKTYRLTEMPPVQSERWAMRVLLLLAKSGVDLPAEISTLGMAGVASLIKMAPEADAAMAPELKQFLKGQAAIWFFNMLAGVDFDVATPLLDEMIGCVSFVSSAGVVRPLIAAGDNPDIEDVATYLRLRAEVLELHTGFSIPEHLSGSQESKEKPPQEKPPAPKPSRTRMSFKPSGQSSVIG